MIEVLLNEEQVRHLVTEAVILARNTTPGNVCDEAVVQWTMKDHHRDGRWRSRLFEPITIDESGIVQDPSSDIGQARATTSSEAAHGGSSVVT